MWNAFEDLPELDRVARRVIEIVVVINNVQGIGALGHLDGAFRDFGCFLLAVEVIETFRDCAAFDVTRRVSAVKPQIAQLWIGDVIFRGHHHEMILGGRIDRN